MNKRFSTLEIIGVLFLLVIGAYACQYREIDADEKIYLVSACYLDAGIRLNYEHPELVKSFYNIVLPKQYKEAIISDRRFLTKMLWDRGDKTFSDWSQRNLVYAGIAYLSIINAVLITLLLFSYFYIKKDSLSFLIVFVALFLSGYLFSAMLDGWLLSLLVIAYSAINNNKEWGWSVALVALPLIKFYGFVLSFAFIFLFGGGFRDALTKILVLGAAVVLLYGIPELVTGAIHYFHQQFEAQSFPLVYRYVSVPAMFFLIYVLEERGVKNG